MCPFVVLSLCFCSLQSAPCPADESKTCTPDAPCYAQPKANIYYLSPSPSHHLLPFLSPFRPPARPLPRCHLPVQRWAARGGAARPHFHTLQRRAVALGDAHDGASDAGGVKQPRAPMRRRPLVWPRGHLPTAARGSQLPVGPWGEVHPGACAWGERQRRVSASWPAGARGGESARHHPRCFGDLLGSCPECAGR